MNSTRLKDLPSVDKVLLHIKDNISIHERYMKYLINYELSSLRADIKKGASFGSSGLLKKRTAKTSHLFEEELMIDQQRKLIAVLAVWFWHLRPTVPKDDRRTL